MKAITLTQPWATLMAIGAKRIETRSWATSYRGELAIHAGKGLGPVGGKRGLYDQCYTPPFLEVLEPFMTGDWELADMIIPYIDPGLLPRGAIVAVVNLIGCEPTWSIVEDQGARRATNIGLLDWPLTDLECAFGDYSPGRYGWLTTNLIALPTPVPCKGALSIWDVPAEVEAQIRAQLNP